MARIILDFYKGKDLYSDGDIEDEILNLLKEYSDEEVIEKDSRWPIFYHLSPIRKNILSWYQLDKSKTILEIGAGMGAITGLLCEKARFVTSVELSKQRADILYERHGDCENLEIIVGNLNDIVFEKKYDYIMLIGVYEYAKQFTDGDTPYKTFLDNIKGLLTENGRIIISIENRLGLKYWCGAAEDHTGIPFYSIEKYPQDSPAQTFDKSELISLVRSCGFEGIEFYYPFPDYKFVQMIYSEQYPLSPSDIGKMRISYDENAILVYEEKNIWPDIIANNIWTSFSNSFFVQISSQPQKPNRVSAASFTSDRKPEYQVTTLILHDNRVIKRANTTKANAHLNKLIRNTLLLESKGIRVCRWNENQPGEIESNLLNFPKLDELLLYSSKNKEWDEFWNYLSLHKKAVEKAPEFTDMIYSNCCYDRENEELVFFDQEWYDANSACGYIFYRSINLLFHMNNEINQSITKEALFVFYGMDLDDIDQYRIQEDIFMNTVYERKTRSILNSMFPRKDQFLKSILSKTSDDMDILKSEIVRLDNECKLLDKDRETIRTEYKKVWYDREKVIIDRKRLHIELNSVLKGKSLSEELYRQMRQQIEKHEKQIDEYNQQIDAYKQQIDKYELQIDSYKQQIDEYELQIDSYKQQIDEYELQIDGYKQQIDEYELQIDGYRQQIENVNKKMTSTNNEVQLLKYKNNIYIEELKQRNIALNQANNKITILDNTVSILHNSRFYRYSQMLYALRNKLVPHKSFRYNVLKKIQKEWNRIKSKSVRNRHHINLQGPLTSADIRVSIVIPTFNAGAEFKMLLDMLYRQELIEGIELIVVDSGSQDDTIVNANEYNAKVILITQEQFSHSYARNLGAESATSEYILFMTQDALPGDVNWIRKMYEPMNINKQIVAVSCAEKPKIDADLFGLACSWGHARFMESLDKDKIMQMPKDSNYESIRKNANLNDVACLVKKSIFNQFKYRFNYAEDLDLGKRLIEEGHKLALLSSAYVIHSHTRPAYYYLKRAYVERKAFHKIFTEQPIHFISDIDFLYGSLKLYQYALYINEQILALPNNFTLCTFSQKVNEIIKSAPKILDGEFCFNVANRLWDEKLYDLMLLITSHIDIQSDDYIKSSALNLFLPYYHGQSGMILDYVTQHYEKVTTGMLDMFVKALLCVCANAIGDMLGYTWLNSCGSSKLLRAFYDEAGKGV